VQHLFKLAIEFVIEPYADRYNFGFQKGKCAHMAVGEIATILNMKMKRLRKVCDNKREQDSKYFVSTKWVIDVDIKAFFGQISYQWILNNFPMPSGTKRIIKEWLKSPIEYQGELKVFAMGVLQGSVISPLIVNLTLDGLEERVTTRQQTTMTNLKRTKWIKGKGHNSFFC
jgi:RNA-directed DNA polymerase